MLRIGRERALLLSQRHEEWLNCHNSPPSFGNLAAAGIATTATATAIADSNNNDYAIDTTSQRNLASLAEKWNLTEPTFEYASNTFSLEFAVTDYINTGMVGYSLWTAPLCQEGDENIEGSPAWSSVSLTENAALQAANVFGAGGTQLDSGSFTNRAATVAATFNTEAISSTSLYTEGRDAEGNLSAEVEFCIRFGLFTRSEQGITGDEVEVNFLETLITLTVDLTDGFDIQNINVTPKDRLERTANVAYNVRGFQCFADKSQIPDPVFERNQGDVINVCVTPEDVAIGDGLFMRSIDSFEWSRTVAGQPDITQPAVVGNEPSGNLLTDYDPDACIGTLVCQFSSILIADFFFLPGQVEGSGVASLQFGQSNVVPARKLRAGAAGRRALQEGVVDQESPAAAEFDLSIGINQAVARSTSGASGSSMGAALSLGAIAAAAAML